MNFSMKAGMVLGALGVVYLPKMITSLTRTAVKGGVVVSRKAKSMIDDASAELDAAEA